MSEAVEDATPTEPKSDEKKKEKRAGRYLASVAVYDKEVHGPGGLTVHQLNRIFKSETAAENAIFEWLKSEYMGKRDVRDFLGELSEDSDELELDDLQGWLKENKGLYVEFGVVRLDD
jgi:trans-aconitate methyltransferase